MNFAYVHRLTSGAARLFVVVVVASAVSLAPMMVKAQVTTNVPQTPAPMKDLGKHATASPTPLLELVQEVERSNPEIPASLHAWQAATTVPKQVSALPHTALTVHHFSLGSLRPSPAHSHTDFPYPAIAHPPLLPP